MTPELKSLWLTALRSGNYSQGKKNLHKNNDFCCLGVLCDVAGYEWKDFDKDNPDLKTCSAGTDYIENDQELKNLGLPKDIHVLCYCLNDGTLINHPPYPDRPHTFSEIADILEKLL